MSNIITQFLAWLSKEIMLGVIITWCSIFSLAAQTPDYATITKNIIDSNSKSEVFVQEGVPIPNDESAPTFTPDGSTVYLADNNTICVSKLAGGKWTKPKTAPFSGQWKDWDPFLSPDGKRLVFVSNRPLPGMPQDKPQKNNQLWYVDRLSGDDWSSPRHFDAPVNLDGFNDYAPSISNSGTLCFCSRGRDGNKGMGGYYTKWLGDHYDKPKQLFLNGDNDIFDPYIAPDESYILFGSNKNLYISYRQGNSWSAGQKLNNKVNNGNFNGGPYVSPGGKMLYYSQDHAPGILMVPINIPKQIL
jgi:Tol biopolymer transport system component